MIVAKRSPSSTTALESRHSPFSCTEKTFVVIDLANAGKAVMIPTNSMERTARMTEPTSQPAGVEVGDSTYEAMRAKVAGSNLDPQTFLATDYLNHFNEVVMLIEMILDMPEILEDAKEWQPKAYKDHFRDSTIADREIAIEAYDAVPDVYNIPARHLQLIRSIPNKSVLSAVVGMKKQTHVRANLEVVKKAPMSRTDFINSVRPVLRSEFIEDSLDM